MHMAIAVLALATAVPGALAQQPDDPFEKTEETPRERKAPSWFHRVRQDSPAAQLAHAHELLSEGELRRAARAYNALVHRWHNAPEAVQAQLSYAMVLFDLRKFTKAFDEFQYLVEQFSGQFAHDEAIRHQYQIANHVMTARHGRMFVFKGFTDPEEALPLFEKVVANAPAWPEAARARLTIGMIHEDAEEYEDAVTAYEAVEHHHPRSPEAEDAAYRKAKCLYTLARKARRDERSCRSALSALSTYKARYPSGEWVAEVDAWLTEMQGHLAGLYYDRAIFYDRLAKRPESALIAYRDFIRKFPTAPQADAVDRRIRELERRGEETP